MATVNANYNQNVDALFNSIFINFYTGSSTANGISVGEANLAAGQVMPSSVVWAGGCYGDGVVVAVSSTSGTSAAVSYNGGQSGLGIWRAKTLPTTATWKAVAFGNGKFVAISNNAGGTAAATSVDKGETWQASTMGSLSGATHNSIAYGNGVWVAIDSTSGSNQLRTNVYNGSSWTAYTKSSGLTCTGTWTSITFGNGQFVAVCSGSAVAATSTDGINWTQRTLPSAIAWSSVVWGGTGFYTCNKYVAVAATSGTAYAYSDDGITWTAGVLPTGTYNSIAYGGWDGIFMAVNTTNGAGGMATSVDGINWTSRSTAAANSGFVMFAPIPWCSGDDLIINNGALVTQDTDQTKYWKTISIVDGKFQITNTSTSTPMRFGTGKITSATQARTITCTNGLGTFEVDGDFIQLGTTSNGLASQTRTSPFTTGDYIPAVWVENDPVGAPGVYEIYTNVTSMRSYDVFSTARNGLRSVGPGNGGTCFVQNGDQNKVQYEVLAAGSTRVGSRVVTVTSTSGLDVGSLVIGRGIGSLIAQPYGAIVESIVNSTTFIMNLPATETNSSLTLIAIAPLSQQFGTTLTFGDGVNGKIPPNGAKIYVPNIMLTDYTSALLQSTWGATTDLPCRFGGNSAAGIWSFNKCLFGESLGDYGQAQSVTMTDVGHSYVPFISECYQVNWTRVGCALPPVVQYCVWTAVGAATGVTTSTSTTVSWTGASATIMPGALMIAVTTAGLHACRVQTVAANRLSCVVDIAAFATTSSNTLYYVGPWTPRDYRAAQVSLNAASTAHSLSGIGWIYVSNASLTNVTLTYGGFVFVATAPGQNVANNGGITIQYSNDVTATNCKIIRTGIQTRSRPYETGVQLLTEGNTVSFVGLEVYNLPVSAMSNVANISFTNTKSRHGIQNEGYNFLAGHRAYRNPADATNLALNTKYWLKTRSYRTHDFNESQGYIDSLPVCAAISNNTEDDHMPKYFAATPNFSSLIAPTLAFGAGVWVTLVPGTQFAMYSSNASDWYMSVLPASTTWHKVIYAGDRFVASSGGIAASTVYAWSFNGIDWVQANTSGTAYYCQAIAYCSGMASNKLVSIGGAAAAYSGNLTAYSSDGGITWTSGTNAATATWVDVATNGTSQFVCISGGGTASTATSYSANGNTWSTGQALASSLWQSIAYGNGKYVAISASAVNGPTAYSSNPASVAWTASTAPSLPTGQTWVNIFYTGSLFVILSGVPAQSYATIPPAVGSFSQYCATSSDGITWSALKPMPEYTTWTSCWGTGTVVGAISTQSGIWCYSNDISAGTPAWNTYRTNCAVYNRIAWERKDPCFTTTFSSLTSGATTANSTTVTCASTAGLFIGAIISTATPGIFPAKAMFGTLPGVVVTGITNATTFTVNLNALRDSTGQTFTVTKNCYQVFRSTTEGFTGRTAAELKFSSATAATNLFDDGLSIAPGTTYYYRLRKLNASATLANCSAVNGATTVTTSNSYYLWQNLNGFEGASGSNILTTKAQNIYSLGIEVGAIVTHANIPAGTTITEITDYNQIILSANLTGPISPTGLVANKVGFSPAPGQYIFGGCVGNDCKVVSIDSATSMTVSVANAYTMTNQTLTFVTGNETAEIACKPQLPAIVQNNLLQSNSFGTTWTNSSSIALTSAAVYTPFDNIYGIAAAANLATGWKAQAIATNSVLSQVVKCGGSGYGTIIFSVWARADLPTNASYVQVTLDCGGVTNTVTLTNKWARYSVSNASVTAGTVTCSITFPLVNQQVYIAYAAVNMTLGSETLPINTTATTTAPFIQGGGTAAAQILQQNFSRTAATMGAAGWNIDGGSGIELNLDTAPTGQMFAHIHLGTTSTFTISDANQIMSTETGNSANDALFACSTGLAGLTVDTYESVSLGNAPAGPMLYALNGASNITMKDLIHPMNGAGQYWFNLVPAYNIYIHNADVDNIKNGVALYMDGATTNASKNVKLQNIRSNKARLPWSNQALNMDMKGVCGAHAEPANNAVIWNLSTNPTIDNLPIGQTAIYDSMFHEMTRGTNKGCLQVNMVGSAKVSKPYTVTAGNPYFKNDGGLAMKTAGDQMVIEWPNWIKGVTGFSERMPVIYGTDLGLEATMTNIGCLVEYDLDKGSGYSGSWQRLTGNPDLISAETGIDTTIGFKIKLRLTARQGFKYASQGTGDGAQFTVGQTIWNASANPTATAVIVEDEDLGATGTLILSNITGIWGIGNTIYTTAGVSTSATVTATNTISPYFPHVASKIQGIRIYTENDNSKKYDFSQATLTLTGLKDNTEVRLITSGTNNEVYGVENVTDGTVNNRTFSYTYGYGGLTYVDVVIMSIGYEYMVIKNLPLTSSNSSIPISQRADRNYQNL